MSFHKIDNNIITKEINILMLIKFTYLKKKNIVLLKKIFLLKFYLLSYYQVYENKINLINNYIYSLFK